MEDRRDCVVDTEQVTRAARALLAYRKAKENVGKSLLNEHDWVSLMVTVWRIPGCPQTIRIPLPHGIRPDTSEVCLFTRDEPNMSSEQTESYYKKVLAQHGVRHVTKVIPLKQMKKEYKAFEAKRRLLGSFDCFLADARIRRLLPSHIGKHFYKEKREPQSVNLKAKNLAGELNRFIQGTQLHVTNKGCCYAIRVGHTGMEAEDLTDNVLAVARVLAERLPMKWRNVKVLHLKTQTSVALPVYNSPIDNMKKPTKRNTKHQPAAALGEEKEEEEEQIPELVPIQTPDTGAKKKRRARKTPREDGDSAAESQKPEAKPSAKRHKTSDQEAAVPSKAEADDRDRREAAPKTTLKKSALKAKICKRKKKTPVTKNFTGKKN